MSLTYHDFNNYLRTGIIEIKSLNFHMQQLNELHTEIFNITTLLELTAYRNHITCIPKNLSILDLSFNKITHLPIELSECIHLSSLNVSYNLLSYIPDNLFDNLSITSLYLNNNLLTKLPLSIEKIDPYEITVINIFTYTYKCM